MSTKTDFTSSGLKIEGAYENDRNSENAPLYKDIIREVFGVTDVICGHHLVYEVRDKRIVDGKEFVYETIQEIPSADALIFDHDVASKLWPDDWKRILPILAMTPVAERDKLLGDFYYGNRTHTKDQSAHDHD